MTAAAQTCQGTTATTEEVPSLCRATDNANAEKLGIGKTPTSKWEKRVLLFTPSWFSINMGTGIVSILLHTCPYQFNGLGEIAIIFFLLNLALFVAFLVMSIMRYLRWPKVFVLMITHPTQAFFLGTFSMGFATIVNMTALVGIPAFGPPFVILAWTLWWIDALISLLVHLGVCYSLFNHQTQTLESLTAIWLLPAVSPIVSAASGGIVASYLSPQQARLTIVVSYILWGTAFPVACLLMAGYIQRLSIHHMPPAQAIVSSFLPLGPCGQGAFALLKFASVIRDMYLAGDRFLDGGVSRYSEGDERIFSMAVFAVTIPVALVIWGFGFFWLVMAVAGCSKVVSGSISVEG